jgi:hypothetical protein
MKKTRTSRESVHRMGDKLQAILSYLELEEHDKAIKVAKEVQGELHRQKAIKAAREVTVQLTHMKNVMDSHVKLPKHGSVVVVPHGTRVVSHEDVTEDVGADEVRVLDQSSVRVGHGTHNPKTK